MPLVGEKIELDFQSWVGDDTLTIEARLKDETGVAVVGSPVDLTNKLDGKYLDRTIDYPDKVKVTVTLIPYEDALKTKESTIETRATQVFEREQPFPDIISGGIGIDAEFCVEGQLDAEFELEGGVDGDIEAEPGIDGDVEQEPGLDGDINQEPELEIT